LPHKQTQEEVKTRTAREAESKEMHSKISEVASLGRGTAQTSVLSTPPYIAFVGLFSPPQIQIC